MKLIRYQVRKHTEYKREREMGRIDEEWIKEEIKG
jgi:hypothetical protein